ncbi:MAG: shikimate dehydrogenase [Burkholderiaceae bacterium]|nr:shikimate dehydrogenase [Burkholderiaceae bacterium]
MSDRYAVIGNPIAHSRSPFIHARFAAQTGQDLVYDRLLAPLDGFAAAVQAFVESGGRGLNVTVPFKEQAFALAGRRSPRVEAAGAANTLSFDSNGWTAENTDGIGLVRDLTARHGVALAGQRVVVLGAGGAASGVVLPLLEAGVRDVLIVNRTAARAVALASRLAGAAGPQTAVVGRGLDGLDAESAAGALLINATSAGLSDARLPIADEVFAAAAFAYDMVYGARPTAFLAQAAALGCPRQADGLGMLVEQAAESFRLWRGVAPQTDPVYRQLRDEIGRA